MHPFPYKIHRKHIAFMVSLACILLWGVLCSAVFAEAPHSGKPEYVPLVGIPYAQNASGKGLANYLNSIYVLTMILGGIIAVIRIMIAGVKYSFSDIVTDKEQGKKEIKGTLFGLAILLVPFIVLSTIYSGADGKSGLTNLNILGGVDRINLSSQPSTGVSTNPDAITRPEDIKVNTAEQQLNYTSKEVDTGTKDQFGAPITLRVYDSTDAKAFCAGKNGSFVEISESAGKCTFLETSKPEDSLGGQGGSIPGA